MHPIIISLGFLSLIAAAGYIVLAVVAVLTARRRRRPTSSSSQPPVTVLKPLCGAEPGSTENLRSFCTQNYPQFRDRIRRSRSRPIPPARWSSG